MSIHTFAGAAITNHNAAAELAQREADQAKAGVVPEVSELDRLVDTYAMRLIFAGQNKESFGLVLREMLQQYRPHVVGECFEYRDTPPQERKNFVWKW